MSKKITSRQFAALKRTAMNNYPLVQKREKIAAQLTDLMKEYEDINANIEGAETGSRIISGGFNSLDLIERVVVTKTNTNGEEVKMTKFIPKAGVMQANEDGSYEILVEKEPEAPATPEVPAEGAQKEATTPANEE